MEKEITALKWLIEQYKKCGHLDIKTVEEAIQMEEKQIIEAYLKSHFGNNIITDDPSDERVVHRAISYYHRKFKNEI